MLRSRLDILPPPQRQLWDELDQVPASFVLYGGTALALRLGHRVSEDFDFFNDPFTPPNLERDIPFLRGAVRLQASPNTLVSAVERAGAVKVSFFGSLGLRRVQDPERSEVPRLHIASLLDLAATKVKVVQDRAESKDYLDIAQLLAEGIDLGEALGAARSVYGPSFNPLLSVKALCYFGDGDLGSLPAEIRAHLVTAAQAVDPTELPEVPARPGGLRP